MAVYTFKNVYQQVLQQTDEKLDVDQARAVAQDLVNNAHELRCMEYPEILLWDTDETLTTVVGQKSYSLHELFDRPYYFYNQTTKSLMSQAPRRNLETEVNGLSTDITGSAQHFMLRGVSPVLAQPTSASVITLVSTSALDTGANYEVVIKGINSSNELFAEKVTLTGTTPALTTSSYTKILAVSKERVFNGLLTVTSNAAAVTNLRLQPDEFGRQYQQLWLPSTPTSAEVINYRFYRKPTYLVNDYDIPDIPAPYSRILVYDALLQWGAYNADTTDKTLNLWKELQLQWEQRLYAYIKEGQSLGAQTRKVRASSDYFDVGIDIAR